MRITTAALSGSSVRALAAGLSALALAAVTVAVTSAPASAATLLDDGFKITEQELDFGDGSFTIWDRPNNDGHIVVDVTNGLTTVELDGKIYINNAAGTCGRMRIETFDLNGALLNSRNGGTVCAPNGKAHSWTVDLDSTPVVGVEEVTVKLQVENANGTFSTAGSETWIL